MTLKGKLRAFTLIELLIVMVILAVLASIATPIYAGHVTKARRIGTIAEIANIKSALATFEANNARFPTTNEGLAALINCPSDLTATYAGPYIEKIPEDKWGHPYVYTCPGTNDPTSYDLISAGPDGQFGTDDDIDKLTAN